MPGIRWVLSLVLFCTTQVALADGPKDNSVTTVRPIPSPGVVIDPDTRATLVNNLSLLNEKLASLRGSKSLNIQKYLPDVEIFSRALELALNEDGFFDPQEAVRAQSVIAEGLQRADALAQEQTPWRRATGLVPRGYRSKLDGTVQPYGVAYYPVDANQAYPSSMRADLWCRGRSERGLEIQFLTSRMTSNYPEPAPGVIMIHPFGRYCNANKLAGEIDTLEVLQHALEDYPIDPQRVAIRGFSMGGAAAWHLAVHYPDKWFAANPGAGFSETPEFLKVFQKEELQPYPFEQKLWQMYDCPVWARNIRMLPTIAYSGEIDNQKQAADIMAAACWNLPERERFELTHIIAPKTAHRIDPSAQAEIERRLASLDRLRSTKPPQVVTFTTTTLKYNKSHWVTVDALQEHWKPAQIRASLPGSGDGTLRVQTENISEFTLEFSAADVPFDSLKASVRVTSAELEAQIAANRGEFQRLIEQVQSSDPKASEEARLQLRDGMKAGHFPGHILGSKHQNPEDFLSSIKRKEATISVPLQSDRSWKARFRLADDGTWGLVSPIEPTTKELRKKHGLQGPIDDALMGPFLFVKPSSPGRFPEVDQWVDAEMNRAVREWHRQMRGEVRVKSSAEVTPQDIENFHLILWGDSHSNPTLTQIVDKLPIHWGEDRITVGQQQFPAQSHVPVLIYPNPLNSEKYVVLNSGFTYREYDYLNNARQVPKLPDWAIIDLSTPPDARWPGKIAVGDFFGEKWELKTKP